MPNKNFLSIILGKFWVFLKVFLFFCADDTEAPYFHGQKGASGVGGVFKKLKRRSAADRFYTKTNPFQAYACADTKSAPNLPKRAVDLFAAGNADVSSNVSTPDRRTIHNNRRIAINFQ